MKTIPEKSRIPFKLKIIGIVLLVTMLIPRFNVCECEINVRRLEAEIYQVYSYDKVNPENSLDVENGLRVCILGIPVFDNNPGYLSSRNHGVMNEIEDFLAILILVLVKLLLISLPVFIISLFPKRFEIQERDCVYKYADLYRIIKIKKPAPEKEGKYIKSKKVAICGITVRDDCPNEVFLGFPTYKKSYMLMEQLNESNKTE